MQFLGNVFGIEAHVLIDIASNHCYLSSSYFKHIGLHVKENNSKTVLGNGFQVEMEGPSKCI